ncbi:probable NDE1 - mitochondrial cytosolically directed NADH dehydrogenase [Cephalotrichum gorgonifer]|uniref:NADH:ubiquinone reductase (non-electrogenic) n=1 Tax=Cephalotrichum gorgonifer TaxID=2041049 RepID=A0AAE8MZW6_9PEZI|nr:probable NDE1 - mitochondrial cytosolically directed NADH dehydrogenase [Cephalotrichum gorgonifer]
MAPSSVMALRAAAATRSPLATKLRAPPAAARAFSQSTRSVRRPSAALQQQLPKTQQALTRQFRRAFSDDAPRRGPGAVRLTFRWLWRLTYLSALGYMGYVGYVVYGDRHPPPQNPPDPTKKTLVILGTGWGSVSLLKKLDTDNYNVIVISPRNYFLFTPLLPSCTTGTVEHRSIMEPIRSILHQKRTGVTFYEAEATEIDPERKVVKIRDESDIKGAMSSSEVPYDMLVVGVGAENATFGIPGVRENSCFLKEIGDAQNIRKKIMDCVETAAFKDQTDEEIDRLLHMVVVGGGPTGVEFAGELQDFFEEDIKKLIPNLSARFKVTLIEALPNVLPSFSKTLIDYTHDTFKEQTIDIMTQTFVKNVTANDITAVATRPGGVKETVTIPYGLLVWATGNAIRPIVKDLISKIPAQAKSTRGLSVNEYLVVQGARDIWAVGDCAVAGYAPTAQVAGQEGAFLARLFNNMAMTEHLQSHIQTLSASLNMAPGGDSARTAEEIERCEKQLRRIKDVKPFHYSHQGSLAYIGSDRAVADVRWWNANLATGGKMTYLFWRSAYLSMCFSTRNRLLVANDWVKSKVFGRDVSRE